jgi:phage/plasmid-associated DNA primase
MCYQPDHPTTPQPPQQKAAKKSADHHGPRTLLPDPVAYGVPAAYAPKRKQRPPESDAPAPVASTSTAASSSSTSAYWEDTEESPTRAEPYVAPKPARKLLLGQRRISTPGPYFGCANPLYDPALARHVARGTLAKQPDVVAPPAPLRNPMLVVGTAMPQAPVAQIGGGTTVTLSVSASVPTPPSAKATLLKSSEIGTTGAGQVQRQQPQKEPGSNCTTPVPEQTQRTPAPAPPVPSTSAITPAPTLPVPSTSAITPAPALPVPSTSAITPAPALPVPSTSAIASSSTSASQAVLVPPPALPSTSASQVGLVPPPALPSTSTSTTSSGPDQRGLQLPDEKIVTKEVLSRQGMAGAVIALARHWKCRVFCTGKGPDKRVYAYCGATALWTSDPSLDVYQDLSLIFPKLVITTTTGASFDLANASLYASLTALALNYLVDVSAEAKIDTAEHLIPVNGARVVDLTTGIARPRTKEDYFTYELPYAWDANADTAPAADLFLKLQCGDQTSAKYLQRLMGYCSLLSGNPELKLVFLCGPTDSGKSTLMELINDLIGPMGHRSKKELLLKTGATLSPEAAQPFVSSFKKKHMIFMSELKDGQEISSDAAKYFTEKKITCRTLFQKTPETIPVTWKIVVDTNYPPICDGTDTALTKRLVNVEFKAHFVADPAKVDPELGVYAKIPYFVEKFKEAGLMSGLLKFLVQGVVEYYANVRAGAMDPFETPAAVVEHTAEYMADFDDVGEFLAACTIAQPGGSVGATALYHRYEQWCTENKKKPRTQTSFGLAMASRRIGRKKMTKIIAYMGIQMKI